MTARLCLLAAIGMFPIFAQTQIQDLATTEDGAVVYFSSPLRLKGTSQPFTTSSS